MNRLIVQATFTPITQCEAECSEETCETKPDFTVSIWPEAEHGPFEESHALHSCKAHMIEVCSFVGGIIHDTLVSERDRFYGEGGEANE